jgi:hypothetical protein
LGDKQIGCQYDKIEADKEEDRVGGNASRTSCRSRAPNPTSEIPVGSARRLSLYVKGFVLM